MSTSTADEILSILGSAALESSNEVTNWLDTGFAPLNHAISGRYDGGFAYGRLYEVFGPSSSGKTILASSAMIAAQQQGGAAIFVDFEHAFDPTLSAKNGLSLEMPKWVYINPRSFEEGLGKAVEVAQLLRGKLGPGKPIVIVVDSIAAATPKTVLEKKLTDLNMNDSTARSRALSLTLPIIQGICDEGNVTVVFLNQIRLKPGVVFGDPTTTPGGQSMEFYASARVSLGRKQVKKGDAIVGQRITAKVTKSKHTRPFQKCETELSFRDDGAAYFETIGATIDYMVEHGLLKKEGQKIGWEGESMTRPKLIRVIEASGGEAALREKLLESVAVEPAEPTKSSESTE